MKKKLLGVVLGLALLPSVALSDYDNLVVNRSKDGVIVQVVNKETLDNPPYEGNVLFNYRQHEGKWCLVRIEDKGIHDGRRMYDREFVGFVSENEIPTYVDGLGALYIDKDRGEEDIVAVFDNDVRADVKSEWVSIAKEYLQDVIEENND